MLNLDIASFSTFALYNICAKFDFSLDNFCYFIARTVYESEEIVSLVDDKR